MNSNTLQVAGRTEVVVPGTTVAIRDTTGTLLNVATSSQINVSRTSSKSGPATLVTFSTPFIGSVTSW